MKFKLLEEKDFNQSIYSGKDSNNEINKKKYKKHSMSPFVSLDAGDVEHNIEVFNNSVAENGSENSTSLSMGESTKAPHKYKYMGNVYRFNKNQFYDALNKPVYTTAVSKKQAVNFIKSQLKKSYGFDVTASLLIDEDEVEEII